MARGIEMARRVWIGALVVGGASVQAVAGGAARAAGWGRGERGRDGWGGLRDRGAFDEQQPGARLSCRQRIRTPVAKTTKYGRGCSGSETKGRALALSRRAGDWHLRCTF